MAERIHNPALLHDPQFIILRQRDGRKRALLERVVVFLRSMNVHSDRMVSRYGLKRGEEAQLQYELSRGLADSIEKELALGAGQGEQPRRVGKAKPRPTKELRALTGGA